MKSARIHPKRLIVSTLVVLVSLLAILFYLCSRSLSDLADKARSPKPAAASVPSQPDRTSQARVIEAYGKLPLSFEGNQGQTNPKVKFVSRGDGYNLFLTSTEAVLAFGNSVGRTERNEFRTPGSSIRAHRSSPTTDTVLRMKLVGANPNPQVMGQAELPGKINYFIGNDPKKWHTNVSTYAKVKYQNAYPGIDVVYYGRQRHLEYDFIVRPGTDPAIIALSFQGAEQLEVDNQGDLVLHTAGGEIRQRKPFIYQELGGAREEVSGRYVFLSSNSVGFQISPYDTTKPLIIDPTLVYSSYLGGDSSDTGPPSIALDDEGNAYVTGLTSSADYPTTSGAFDTTYNGGGFDCFVTKLNPTGTSLIYSTYLGGAGFDSGLSIAVDAAGNAYVAGRSELAADFPTTPGVIDTTYNGATDTFVTKLDSTGASLAYSTYLGSSGSDIGFDIAVDAAGNVYVFGGTSSTDFPTTTGAFDTTYSGNGDAFITKLNPTGTFIVYSTYLGGNGTDSNNSSIAVDGAGNAYVTGLTNSDDFPTTSGAFDTTYDGSFDGFVTKVNPTGTSLVYSTFLGGAGFEWAHGIAIDGAGNAYVTGYTESADFPTTMGAFDTTYSGNGDGFVSKLASTGASLVYSTYIGGSSSDQGLSIAVDTAGNSYLTGYTSSTNFPTTLGAFDSTFNGGGHDAFVTKLDATGATLLFSTYLGGSDGDTDCNIAVDGAGNAYVTGQTLSANFPMTTSSFDTTFNGATDVFVAKIEIGESPNQPPIANCRNVAKFADNSCQAVMSPQEVDSGSSDPEGGTITLALNPPGLYPIGATAVTLTVTDAFGASSTCTAMITIENPTPAPIITGPASGTIHAVGTPVNFTGSFTDNPGGTHTAIWTFDTIVQPATVVEPVGSTPGSANASYTFSAQGVYMVRLTVNDSCGGTGEATTVGGFDAMVVVYDPNGGFVTGGGWINSPAGAYLNDPILTGKANFGFVSKYQNGASVPTGNTEFQFKGGNLNFKSTAYEWMVVAGKKAQYKGSGMINGTGDYRFLLTVIDGQQPGGGGQDKFRIRIWNNSGGGLVYDNQLSAPESDDPTTVLGGGSIVIHKP